MKTPNRNNKLGVLIIIAIMIITAIGYGSYILITSMSLTILIKTLMGELAMYTLVDAMIKLYDRM